MTGRPGTTAASDTLWQRVRDRLAGGPKGPDRDRIHRGVRKAPDLVPGQNGPVLQETGLRAKGVAPAAQGPCRALPDPPADQAGRL